MVCCVHICRQLIWPNPIYADLQDVDVGLGNLAEIMCDAEGRNLAVH